MTRLAYMHHVILSTRLIVDVILITILSGRKAANSTVRKLGYTILHSEKLFRNEMSEKDCKSERG
jgi:hypothetical protein